MRETLNVYISGARVQSSRLSTLDVIKSATERVAGRIATGSVASRSYRPSSAEDSPQCESAVGAIEEAAPWGDGDRQGAPSGGEGSSETGCESLPDERPRVLTPREAAIANYLRLGSSNKVIAKALGISESTVKFHLKRMYSKLGANGRTHACSIIHELERDCRPVFA